MDNALSFLLEVGYMLELKGLSVAIEDREILHDINLTIGQGETHVLFGPNGSGKTTLLMAVMGFPRYQITRGSIIFKGKDITSAPLDERARLGIGMSFQRPPVVRGVKTQDMVSASLQRPPVVRGVKTQDMVSASLGDREDEATITTLAERANMTDLLDRDINYGFSGGEIKRSELMQLQAQRPELTLLDEPESGVDLVNIALIGELINELVNARTGYVMVNGRISCGGDPHEILATIKEKGYEECARCILGGAQWLR
jgi:Fe-S cluster assembly ATP-binding protein